jgi:ferritin-like protein
MDKQNTANSLGLNRTGAMMSPIDSAKTAEGAQTYTHPLSGDEYTGLGGNRIRYMKDSGALGTVPVPATLKGAMSSMQEKIMNGDHAFLDKLGERIAFERTGYRLYDALISKYQGTSDKSGFPSLEEIEEIHSDELQHFHMLCEAMTSIGGDPTSMTPAADVAGVAALGWVQAITDPRTDFKQCLEIILQAELVDNACWEVLIELANSLGLTDLSERFTVALTQEQVHLENVKRWVMELNVGRKQLLA